MEMTSVSRDSQPPPVFQSAYGPLQSRHLWVVPVLVVIAAVGIPAGILWNEGWHLRRVPVEPWAATLIIELFAVGALIIAATLAIGTVLRRKTPQYVRFTGDALIVPKGMFSGREVTIALSGNDFRVVDLGFVKQLQSKQRGRKIVLVSARFPSDADFDRLVGHLFKGGLM